MALKTVKKLNKKVEKSQDKSKEAVLSFIERLKKFLNKGLEEVVGNAEDGIKEPAVVLGSMLDSIKKMGLKKELAELSVLYGSELKRVNQVFKDSLIDPPVKVFNKDSFTALVDFNIEQIENKALGVIGELRPKIMESLILDQPIDIAPLKEKLESRLFNQIKTEVNTALNSFYQTATITQAKRLGIEKFIYVGPDDDVTRDFCAELLEGKDPPIYTLDEILAMDNGQGLDVFTSGGGWNCRHEWRPVSEELEQELKDEADAEAQDNGD